MIDRPGYLTELERHKGKSGLIKVVTGVRRCGKSTLLRLFREKLIKEKVSPGRIIDINLEGIENEIFHDGKALYNHVKNRLKTDKLHYVFIDEIQLTSRYEEIANSLRMLPNVDLFVTGSNSRLLSGELATRLTGRYVEIKMLPLSFSEYTSVFPNTNLDILFRNYVEQSSFPEVLAYYEPHKHNGSIKRNGKFHRNDGHWDEGAVRTYLEAIYNGIMFKDVMRQSETIEAALLERIVKFLFSNIGSETSINNMVKMLNYDLKLQRKERKIDAATLETYITGLVNCFVFYKVNRHNIKGREYLLANAKFYAVDTGLRYFLLGSKGADSGHILENVVYLELLRRGYRVSVGKVEEKEVDFVAENANGIEYYQCAETVRGKETLAREISSLNAIPDHNPKFLLTRDYQPKTSHNGIKQLNVLEWLLNKL
jgi:predicted AAA+ superfamily ATPase